MQSKKLLKISSIILVALFILATIITYTMQANYNDPAYQSYKDEYFECDSLDGSLTPDAQIYKAWKNNEPVSC